MSSENFDAYAAYYDALYRDKDYRGEADYICSLARLHRPSAKSVLDLGCGTGVHAWWLARSGYSVTGVDRSTQMLDRARSRSVEHPPLASPPNFIVSDITNFSLDKPVDVALALFDVVSYLTTYDALRAMLRCLRTCVRPGGLFMFDCWYGPAVYTQRPELRVRTLEDERVRLTRIARPQVICERNQIDVNYEIFVERKSDGHIETIHEKHPMRCFFDDELDLLMGEFGLKRKFAGTWFTGERPSVTTWSVVFGYEVA